MALLVSSNSSQMWHMVELVSAGSLPLYHLLGTQVSNMLVQDDQSCTHLLYQIHNSPET